MIYVIVVNLILYFLLKLRVHLVRKFRTSYRIFLQDADGNKQTLEHTIQYLLEQIDIQNKKIAYLCDESEKQWLTIEQIKIVTGADKFCTEKPNSYQEEL